VAIEVRAGTSQDELRQAMAPIFHFFGQLDPDEESTARADGEVVGGAGAFLFELTVPGGRVPAAGVTIVGVLPTHRRRGILRALMRAQLDDVHERGEAVAYLWASEAAIYGRFGYGLASLAGEIDVLRTHTAFAQPAEPYGSTRLVSTEEALELFPPVYDAVAAETPGMFARSRDWWEARSLADPEWRRQGGGELTRVLLEVDGRPEAYALYRVHPSFERGLSTGRTRVLEALGRTPEGVRAIWRYLLDVDWMERLTASLIPPDHPLLLLVADPRQLKLTVGDALWVRLVDMEAALAARSYRAGEPVVLEVADEFCPWNAGRYRVGDGVGRTDGEPDLRVDVTGLGSVYLGGFTFAELARALRVEELREGGIARADARFATDRLPWCPEIF
jgi:predicted acetyltransferase